MKQLLKKCIKQIKSQLCQILFCTSKIILKNYTGIRIEKRNIGTFKLTGERNFCNKKKNSISLITQWDVLDYTSCQTIYMKAIEK